MPKYLQISNLGKISKNAIELLGFSDKRDREDLIGEKGTGLKFSRFQCMRKEIKLFVANEDFISWFEKKELDKQNSQIIFKYKDTNKMN